MDTLGTSLCGSTGQWRAATCDLTPTCTAKNWTSVTLTSRCPPIRSAPLTSPLSTSFTFVGFVDQCKSPAPSVVVPAEPPFLPTIGHLMHWGAGAAFSASPLSPLSTKPIFAIQTVSYRHGKRSIPSEGIFPTTKKLRLKMTVGLIRLLQP